MSNPPEVKDLQERFTSLTNRYNLNLRKRQDAHQEIYEQRQDLRLKGDIFKNLTYTPDAMLIVDDVGEHLAMDTITAHQKPRPGRGEGVETETAREQADKVERWLQANLDANKENDPYYLREIYKCLPYRGECLAFWDVHWDTIEDPEQYPGLPLEIVVPDSRTVTSSLEARKGEPDEVYWEKLVTVSHVMDKAEEWNKGKAIALALGGAASYQLVRLVEWWTKDWMGYFVASAETLPNGSFNIFDAVPFNGDIAVPNKLGFSPWLRVYSGLGTAPYDGDPARPARGLLTGIEDILTQKCRSYTKRDAHTSRYVLPRTVAHVADGYVIKDSDADMNLGGIWKEDNSKVQQWRELQPPPIPEGLMQETAEQDHALESYRPAVTRGVPLPGEPASSMATRLTLATLKWSPMVSSAKQMMARLCSKSLQIVEKIGHVVEIDGMKLGPDDIKGYYSVLIDIEPGNPEQLRFDYMLAMQLWDKIPNKRWIVEKFLHVEDATQFLLDIDMEMAKAKLMNNPAYLDGLFRRVFQRLDMQDELAALDSGPGGALQNSGLPPSPDGGMLAGGAQAPGGISPRNVPGAAGSPSVGAPGLPSARQPETPQMGQARRQQEAMSGSV